MRYFFAQVGKEAAIIDERFNHGGALATDIIEYLQRKPMSLATIARRRGFRAAARRDLRTEGDDHQ